MFSSEKDRDGLLNGRMGVSIVGERIGVSGTFFLCPFPMMLSGVVVVVMGELS